MPKTWACPFWQWEQKGIGMHCKGADISFRNREVRDRYANKYCASVPGWENCPIAEYLCEEYDKKEGGLTWSGIKAL